MKKLLILLLALFPALVTFAANKDLVNDITMVSYEQSWRDSYGALSLKNNTNEEIKNVKMIMTYFDMSDRELDYEEFTKDVDIAPGMTKKLDIPAYEHERNYHFYQSEGLYDNTSFKVKFQLVDYNFEEEINDASEDYNIIENDPYLKESNEEDALLFMLAIVIILILAAISIGLYILVAVMAQKYNRNVVVWVLLSFVASPLLIILILLFIGKDESNEV